MFGRSLVGRKFTPSEGLDATADRNRLGGCFIYLCFALAEEYAEGENVFGRVISDDEDDSGGWVCAGEQGAVC